MLSYPFILPRLAFISCLFFAFTKASLTAQCTNGTQPECTCETAPVLCTIDELDGYTFSMAAFRHPGDGPTPICPGANMTQTNNPTWFAFTAWCTDLNLRVTSTNCTEVQNAIGFQLAIYTDCSFDEVVACNADIQDCNTDDKILSLTGLNIGDVYYFMVDGCLGSYCTVTIDILGVCGQEVIAPWTLPVAGNADPCAGHTETYVAEDLDGAGTYHWFIDDILVAQTQSNIFDILWTTPGTYELCIDASNDPCVPITNAPPQLCSIITVHESEAGILNVTPTSLCLNETITVSSTGYTQGVDNLQTILIADSSGTIVEVIQNSSGTFTSVLNGTYTVYIYNYLLGGATPVIGSNIQDIDCSFACCDLESQSVTFQSIQAVVNNVKCDDNGTGNDETDDTYTFDLLVTGGVNGTRWRSTDGTITGTYGFVQQCGPYLIFAGGLFVDLHDYDTPSCFTSISVDPPIPCSFCTQNIDAGTGGIINCINPVVILNGSSSEAGLYHWTGPNMYSSDTLYSVVSDSGWYYLNVEFANQCSAIDSVFVGLDRDLPVANAGPDQLIDCIHTEVILDGSASYGNNLQLEWTSVNGDIISTQTLFLVNTGGIYLLQLTNTSNGCFSIDTVEVLVDTNEVGLILATVIPENCIGEGNGVIDVSDISGGDPPYSYSLNGLITNTTGLFDNLVPDVYHIQITDRNGCSLDTFLRVDTGIDLNLTLPRVIEITEGESGNITATVNVPATDLNYIQWSPGGLLSCDTCLSTSIETMNNQTLQLTIIHINGCETTAAININVVPGPQIYIPNVFSPNSDGFNDYFTLYANDRVSSILELDIFDRWGEHIYHGTKISPNDPGAGWDGTFHNKEMSPGNFVYYFKLLMLDGSMKTITGDVALIR